MEYIYIAFVDTPGLFAAMIHHHLKQKYIHVVISLDENLDEAYSFGRRNPSVPILAGFEREEKEKIIRAFPTADYMVCRMECTREQKERIAERLRSDYKRRRHYHYAVAGLPFLVMNCPFYQKNHYTCSSYIARILEENNIYIAKKHFSLVTPKDFYRYSDKEVLFEGSLAELMEKQSRREETESSFQPAYSGQIAD